MADILKFAPPPKTAPQKQERTMTLCFGNDIVVELFDEKVRTISDVTILEQAMLELCEIVDTLEAVRGRILDTGNGDPFEDLSTDCPQDSTQSVHRAATAGACNDNLPHTT